MAKSKAVVEREKIEAEARQADANAEKALAEARHAAAMARSEEARAEVCEIASQRESQKRERELAADDHHRVFRFVDPVTPSTAQKCMSQLATWTRIDPGCDIEIEFCSPGGSVVDGLALYDFIQGVRRQGHFVTTSALGYAASMAGILLQAGDKRVMAAESWLLIHEASFGAIGSFGEVEDRVKWIEKIQERILDIFVVRSNMSKAQLKRKWHRTDWWLSSDEALKHGFVDEVR